MYFHALTVFSLDPCLLVSFDYVFFLSWKRQWTNILYLLSLSFLPPCRYTSAISDAFPGIYEHKEYKEFLESYIILFPSLWKA